MGINPKSENAIAFQIKMDFLTIRESDSPWKLYTDGEVLQIGRYIERLMGKLIFALRSP